LNEIFLDPSKHELKELKNLGVVIQQLVQARNLSLKHKDKNLSQRGFRRLKDCVGKTNLIVLFFIIFKAK